MAQVSPAPTDPTPDATGSARSGDPALIGGLFGRTAVALGLCTPEHIALGAATMREREAAGEPARLGEVLVEAGVLTDAQVAAVLAAQHKVVLQCTGCGKQFNAPSHPTGSLPACPTCGGILAAPASPIGGGVERTVAPEPVREDPTPDRASELARDERNEAFAALPGTKLGPYHVDRLLGEGGMGAVFAAHHVVLKRAVALKVLPADLTAEKERVRRFLREAEAMAQVHHPNIVGIHNVGSARGFYYIEMDLVDGGTLRTRVHDGGALPIPEATALVRQIAAGLGEAHARGIVHRDIKPDNVLLTADGVPRLADFGLAKSVEGAKNLTGEGAMMGTPHYMSPEQCRGVGVDARSDVYGLGVVFFELVTGRRPFEGEQAMSVVLRQLNEEAPPPRRFRPDLPVSLGNLIERCLAKDPAERFQDATELGAALDAIARGTELAYTARRIRRRRARLAIGAVALIAAAGGGGALWARLQVGEQVRIIHEGETRGDAVARLAREAQAAYRSGDDVAARTKLGELATLAPNHRLLALRAQMATRDDARAAWARGDCETVSALTTPLCTADPDDAPAAWLRVRAAALVRAREALAAGVTAGVGPTVEVMLAAEPDHPEARALRDAAHALAAAVTATDPAQAAAHARTALAARPECGPARERLAVAIAALTTAAEAAIARRDLPSAETEAARLAEADPDGEATRATRARVVTWRGEYEDRAAVARAALVRGDPATARDQAARAVEAWGSPAATALWREAQTAIHRAAAAAAAAAGEHERSFAESQAAAALAPDAPEVLAEVEAARDRLVEGRVAGARAALAAGRLDHAARGAAAALALEPAHVGARAVARETAERRATPAGFVYLPAGTYPVGDAEEPHHPLRGAVLAACYVAVREVTNTEFAQFLASGGYADDRWWAGVPTEARAQFVDESGRPGPAEWRDGTWPAGQDAWPVVGVSWHEAAAYARAAGGRLPTEDEWEVAAGATPDGRRRTYPWGDTWEPARVGLGRTATLAPVGTRPGDRSPSGCLDMAGNAMEWTASPWADGATHRVIRGGSLDRLAASLLAPEDGCRVARRGARADPLTARLPGLGFRLARDPRGAP